MKSLLNVTVLVSSVLSILSTSLALYDLPDINETISGKNNGEKVSLGESQDKLKRIYISHDVSDTETKTTPVLLANKGKSNTKSSKDYINVFGVKVPNNKT